MAAITSPYCPCCGNLPPPGCDCFGQGSQARKIKGLEEQHRKSNERARELLDTLDSCEECGHTWGCHIDVHGCEIEPGDRDGMALPPCQCQRKPGDDLAGLLEEINGLEVKLADVRTALHDTEEQARRGAKYAEKNSVSTHLELLLLTIAGYSRKALDTLDPEEPTT